MPRVVSVKATWRRRKTPILKWLHCGFLLVTVLRQYHHFNHKNVFLSQKKNTYQIFVCNCRQNNPSSYNINISNVRLTVKCSCLNRDELSFKYHDDCRYQIIWNYRWKRAAIKILNSIHNQWSCWITGKWCKLCFCFNNESTGHSISYVNAFHATGDCRRQVVVF